MSESKNTVVVSADKAGLVVIPSKNNPEWGNIRLTQSRIIVDEKGFARKKTLSALVAGTIEDLKSFGWKAGDKIEGKIIFKEQLEPFNPKDPERDYKIAGKTNVVCCIDGQPIYRKTFYTTNPDANDVFITDEHGNPVAHNNGEDIRAAYLELQEKEKEEKSIGNM